MKEIIEQANAFDILKRMNEEDSKNKTFLLPVFNYFVSGEKVRRGAHITMGVDADTWMDVFHNKRRCILLCIDNEAYKRIENELILESQQGKEQSQFKTFVDNFLSVLPEEERDKLKMYDSLPAIDLSKREQGKEEKEAVEDACRFAEWLDDNYWRIGSTNIWQKDKYMLDTNPETFTTEQLYSQYKNE